ncbi:LysR family transcriptional regulator [Lichenibacterium minor]|nr:LysR family transcriptional regulator [Lichenibacterium minor]
MADLNALMIFAKVVEAKSFTEAARRLDMPVSTVSRRVADLEGEFGARLLLRSTRAVQLTEDGAKLIEQARALAEINDAVDDARSKRRTEASETLRISAPPSISDTVLAPLVAAFRVSFPNVGVKVFISGRIADDFPDGVDLQVKIGPQRKAEQGRLKLITYRHQLVASPSYLRGVKPLLVPRDLLAHPLLAFAFPGVESTWTLTEVGGSKREVLRFRPHLAISDYAGLTSLMLADGGIGDLPPVVQPELMRDGRLVEVLPGWGLPVFDLCLVHPPSRAPSGPMRAFMEFAGDMLPRLFPELSH